MKTKEPPCTEPYARWCERSANQLMVSLLLDVACIISTLVFARLAAKFANIASAKTLNRALGVYLTILGAATVQKTV